MKVTFQSIDIKGFLSIGEAKVDLSEQGSVYIKGVNNSGNTSSNGSGKSSVFEAVIYALTGSTLRGTKEVVNLYWEGYCEVTLELTIDSNHYLVKRTRNHKVHKNNLKLVKNGVDISGDKLRKSELIMESEFGDLTSSLISSIIILGQGLPNKFTDLKPTARKERLEELSKSGEFIDVLKDRLSVKLKTVNSELTELRLKESSLNTLIDFKKGSITRKGAELENLSSKMDENVLSDSDKNLLELELEGLKSELNSISDNHTTVSNKLSEISSIINNLNYRNSQLNSEINRYRSESSKLATSNCPTCNQYISSPDQVSKLQSDYEDKIKSNEVEVSENSDKVKVYTDMTKNLSSKVNDYKNDLLSRTTRINEINSVIIESTTKKDSISGQINAINSELVEIRLEIDESEVELKDLRSEMVKLTDKSGALDYLLKKSSKEFRGYLLRGVVDYLNSKLINYSRELFGTDKLRLVMDDVKIMIEYEERPYENLSGGEKQRADLAMQFSLRDMLMNNLGFSTNLLVIDEGFDNLDESGVNALVKLINTKQDIDSVFTISHHTLSIPFDKTLVVTKDLTRVSSISQAIY